MFAYAYVFVALINEFTGQTCDTSFIGIYFNDFSVILVHMNELSETPHRTSLMEDIFWKIGANNLNETEKKFVGITKSMEKIEFSREICVILWRLENGNCIN